MNLRSSPCEFECKNIHTAKNCITNIFDCDVCASILIRKLNFDLSGLNIHRIPNIKIESETLNVSNNDIREITFLIDNNFIRYLNLSYNNIVDFSPLYTLPRLTTLIISMNQLRYIFTSELIGVNIRIV
jgi:hypothetical protein